MIGNVKRALQQAQQLERAGRAAEAAKLYRAVLGSFPGNVEARRALARLTGATPDPAAQLRALYRNGQFQSVIRRAAGLPGKVRSAAAVQTLIGAAAMELGLADRAEQAFRAAILQAPDRPAGYNNLGLALRAQNRRAEAKAAFEQALKLRPDYAEAWNSLGTILQADADTAGAGAAFRKAAELDPKNPEVWTNLGNLHQTDGQIDAAFDAYHTALALDPVHANANYNLGLALKARGRLAEAVEHYRAAATARPRFAAAHNNLGNALQSLGQLPAAETALRRAVDLSPGDAEAQNNLGTVLQKMGRLDEAVAAFDAALAADPDHAMAQAQRLHQMAHMCDWRAFSDFADLAADLGITGRPVAPLTLLAMEDAPDRQRARALAFADATFGAGAPAPKPPARPKRRDRLRIGYFSADYRSHPVARLIAGMLAAHDRGRFDLFGYSFGPDTGDAMRAELTARFDTFTDIRASGDEEAAALIAGHGLDVAVDLTCHTQHSRTALFGRRVAPVQINYLGYPGTSGAAFMDYIVVDPVLAPPTSHADLTEAPLSLPHSYQPNDSRRPVPRDDKSRTDHGLPEEGLVLCCFNSAYKITPRAFDIWMRVLTELDGAVLWLLESTRWAGDNLRAEARARGVDPGRLIFAPRTANEAHLARHRHADLFLDTFAYNAHTTGSDALWMGVPVVTLAGRQFAARVCASLVTAAGVPELIAGTEADYAARILELAREPDRLAELRARLDATRRTVPLFDTEGYTRALEAGFDQVHRRWREGLPPAPVQVQMP